MATLLTLTRFWFSSQKGVGIGVTAYSLEDAIYLIKSEQLTMSLHPIFDDYIENVDIQELDRHHVRVNMGICTNRGVWYPNLNQ